MVSDLKIIKKKYGEKMERFCRDNFSTILENTGQLSKLLLDNFEPNHDLIDDIIYYDLEVEFKNYIFNLTNTKKEEVKENIKSPKELFDEAGYILYDECKCEEDIQKFRKYYKKGEELCTFNGGRLNSCRVFFAVKKDVDNIKREDFTNPQRQDEYGTSILSIQFTKDDTNTLSIKNRYNHTVLNPDATFSNNLDNIIPDLTDSFEKYYGIVQKFKNDDFDIPNYVRANDGKLYKYNYEMYNIHYCPNNIIIDNRKVKRFDKEKYIILDYFILDIQNKKISLYDETFADTFTETIGNISKISLSKIENGKEIIITPQEGEDIKIGINKNNEIIIYTNDNIKGINDNFLFNNHSLESFSAKKLIKVNACFLYENKCLKNIYVPNLKYIGDSFLAKNRTLSSIYLPSVEQIGVNFLYSDIELKFFHAPSLKYIGDNCLYNNNKLIILDLPSVEIISNYFLYWNNTLMKFSAPNLVSLGYYALNQNHSLEIFNVPNLNHMGDYCLLKNQKLSEFNFPNLNSIGEYVLYNNMYFQSKIKSKTLKYE